MTHRLTHRLTRGTREAYFQTEKKESHQNNKNDYNVKAYCS